jgi:hypothetical protein
MLFGYPSLFASFAMAASGSNRTSHNTLNDRPTYFASCQSAADTVAVVVGETA